jgi:type II secretory pathway pseudopilin PulG
MTNRTLRAFTLLEVLVAGSILFIVSAAVVGLSNSIIQGTALTTDQATANRLATQGLELVTKLRDDNIKNGNFTDGNFVWFEPVAQAADYGWWQLGEIGGSWQLDKDEIDFPQNEINLATLDGTKAEKLSVDQIDFHRFICVEALAANAFTDEEQKIFCNAQNDGNGFIDVNDGTRSEITNCFAGSVGLTYNKDSYCEFTSESLNRNRATGEDKFIPNGNAVKLRSIVIWEDRDQFHTSEVSTLLTNWQSFVQ